MGKRWTIDKINALAEINSESTLLRTEYNGFSQRLLFKCACETNFEKTLSQFTAKGQRKCGICQPIKASRDE